MSADEKEDEIHWIYSIGMVPLGKVSFKLLTFPFDVLVFYIFSFSHNGSRWPFSLFFFFFFFPCTLFALAKWKHMSALSLFVVDPLIFNDAVESFSLALLNIWKKCCRCYKKQILLDFSSTWFVFMCIRCVSCALVWKERCCWFPGSGWAMEKWAR